MVKNTTEQEKRGPHRWRPGTSGNPRGRPPKGSALTDAIRAKVDPDELVEIALRIARGGDDARALAALQWLRDSGYVKPAERHEHVMGTLDGADDDALAEQLTDEQLDALDALDEQRRIVLAKPANALTDAA